MGQVFCYPIYGAFYKTHSAPATRHDSTLVRLLKGLALEHEPKTNYYGVISPQGKSLLEILNVAYRDGTNVRLYRTIFMPFLLDLLRRHA